VPKTFFVLLFLALGVDFAIGQDPAIVSGKVKDEISGEPVVGANIVLHSRNDDLVTVSDSLGHFAINTEPGRYLLRVTFVGYATSVHEVSIISAKETILQINLSPSSTLLESVEVTGYQYSLPGEQSFNIEKTTRIPANFFDPLRMTVSYPGVMVSNDQNNNMIVRGNSPNGILWRLNGLDIVNPNHLSNAGMLSDKPSASGGGVNILSAQLLDQTKFYSGSIPAKYGNLTAGAVDMSLRDGNYNNHEFTTKASLIGLDFAAEGPISSSHMSSFLVNYRYSTVGVLSGLGVNFGDETINFQDLSFNLSFKGKKNRLLSVFGSAGLSRNKFEAKDSLDREEDKDWYDIEYDGSTYLVGATYVHPLPERAKLELGAAWSYSEQMRVTTFMFNEMESYEEDYFKSRGIFSTFFRLTKAFPKGELTFGATINYQADASSW
jgi:hypothetical protein